MRFDEFKPQPFYEMLYKRAKAEHFMTGLEKPINLHLIKLLVIKSEGPNATHWRKELSTWFIDIAEIRLKPHNKPAPAEFYYRILFDEPYGGHEVDHTVSHLQGLAEDYTIDPSTDPSIVVAVLKNFHKDFAKSCAAGNFTRVAVKAMVAGFGLPS